jgi:hypothetical protein
MSGGGYDISASVSESRQTASRAGEGDFIVGGGKQGWVWPVTIGVVVLLAIWIWKK